MWMIVWLLCVLAGTPLWMIGVVFLVVGHTHNNIDRVFCVVVKTVALASRDYFTVVGMLRQIAASLASDAENRPASIGETWLGAQQYMSLIDVVQEPF